MEQSDETANCNDGRQKLHAQQAHLKDMRERLLLYKKRHEAVLRDEEKREKEEAEQNRRVEEERQRLEEERQGSQLPEKRQLTHSAGRHE
ncbi:hypothetical protein EC973_000389 [Apophysomyces ossiformis]|uniref:Uncharacterized protein n=1 Tax=Apophysomyces ossiformis TaxID=679940 RepID=A0A8H7BL90_9FUNG|nr:hypothetical protein EC973_000389 [Apophysomyces ossiformis]